ncbi:hypothetical protein [Actinomadura violacea]|uniref:Secreted protein/lipoprotein n=1 Tax=Actinomadura violacea TaxID=2819934 RepID=A0ABS3RMU6_9ACTN|nr:hypothetical protein [Actinomadura violacea]MBO2458052.1 hypothetical protein [Actinomadura violacea]
MSFISPDTAPPGSSPETGSSRPARATSSLIRRATGPGGRGARQAGVTAALLVLSVGCGSSSDREPDAPHAASTAQDKSTGQDKGQQAKAEAGAKALAAYRGMWATQFKAYSSGSMKNAGLGDYTTGDAAASIISVLTYYNKVGLSFKTKPVISPKVTSVDIASDPRTATISDCVDMTGVLVRRATGELLPATKDDRRPWTAQATTAKGGTDWRISGYTIDKTRSC